jgi:hypothetical protein
MLLQRLCRYASSENMPKLENIWRSAITDWVVAEATALVKQPAASAAAAAVAGHGPQQGRSRDLVDVLASMLKRARTVSRVEMADSKMCFMSADFAFQRAFQRLSKPIAIELAKVLAVRMSTLLDSHRRDVLYSRWAKALELTTDLVQVLCAQSATDFQYFYELLMARRLLRARFLSLDIERQALTALPAMNKARLMLRDIEQTVPRMVHFRKFVLHEIDFNLANFSDDTLRLVFDEGFTAYTVAGAVWPTAVTQPTMYTNLRLPEELKVRARKLLCVFVLIGKFGGVSHTRHLCVLRCVLSSKLRAASRSSSSRTTRSGPTRRAPALAACSGAMASAPSRCVTRPITSIKCTSCCPCRRRACCWR